MKSSRNDTKQLARVRDIFDEWAITGRAGGMERGHSPAALRAFATLELAAGQRYLDIGCGNGYSVRWAARVAPSVDALGIDVSPQMITLARQLTDGLPNARFRRLHFPSPLLPRRSFHALFTMEALYYVPSPAEAVCEMHGLLMPGGRLACVMDYYGENEASHDWPEDLNVGMHLLSADEWQQAFESAGFEAVRQERLRAPLEPGQEATWKHTEGSLLITGRRRPKN